jgi:hypothetical protein
MRTLTAYGIGVVIVLAALNSIVWLARNPQLHNINVFSAGPGGARDVYCGLALRISPRRLLIALAV